MGGGKKRAKMPAAQDPIPAPVPLDVEVLEKERARRKQKVRAAGRQSTILTQGGLGGSDTEVKKGTLLGGSA